MDLINLQYNESFEMDVKGERVKVTLFKNKDNSGDFTFGIEAPKSISINREEKSKPQAS